MQILIPIFGVWLLVIITVIIFSRKLDKKKKQDKIDLNIDTKDLKEALEANNLEEINRILIRLVKNHHVGLVELEDLIEEVGQERINHPELYEAKNQMIFLRAKWGIHPKELFIRKSHKG